MIFKSYIFEENLQNLKENYYLLFGENVGLKEDLKKIIKSIFNSHEFLYFTQDQLIKDDEILYREMSSDSLFRKEVIFFISEANDKILEAIKEITEKFNDKKIFIFADLLEKKSKLRNFFEKSDNCGTVPCYADDESSIRKIILHKLSHIKGLTPDCVNLILENSNLNRLKLNNEISKIITCFYKEPLSLKKLNNLLNTKTNDNFSNLKDEALCGNKTRTNKLLSETMLEDEKIILYLNIINQSLNKLLQFANVSESLNLENSLKEIKPPIFWKDKPKFIEQTKKWNKMKLNKIINQLYNLELNIKSKFSINKNVVLKKFVLDICKTANS